MLKFCRVHQLLWATWLATAAKERDAGLKKKRPSSVLLNMTARRARHASCPPTCVYVPSPSQAASVFGAGDTATAREARKSDKQALLPIVDAHAPS
eukprot:6209356-Pleurochrysis_carterae.AAC.2